MGNEVGTLEYFSKNPKVYLFTTPVTITIKPHNNDSFNYLPYIVKPYMHFYTSYSLSHWKALHAAAF